MGSSTLIAIMAVASMLELEHLKQLGIIRDYDVSADYQKFTIHLHSGSNAAPELLKMTAHDVVMYLAGVATMMDYVVETIKEKK